MQFNSLGTPEVEQFPQAHKSPGGCWALCGKKIKPMTPEQLAKVAVVENCGEFVKATGGYEPCVECNCVEQGLPHN